MHHGLDLGGGGYTYGPQANSLSCFDPRQERQDSKCTRPATGLTDGFLLSPTSWPHRERTCASFSFVLFWKRNTQAGRQHGVLRARLLQRRSRWPRGAGPAERGRWTET